MDSPLKLQRARKAALPGSPTGQDKQKSSGGAIIAVTSILETTPPPKMNSYQALLERIARTIKELQAEIGKCQDEDVLETMDEELKGLLQALQGL